MPGVAVKGNKIQSNSVSNHITIKKPNEFTCVPGYVDGEYYSGYWYGGKCYGVLAPPSSPYTYNKIPATIEGEINEGSANVFVNGKAVAFSGAKTLEKDTYTIPSGWTIESGNVDDGIRSVGQCGFLIGAGGAAADTDLQPAFDLVVKVKPQGQPVKSGVDDRTVLFKVI